MTLPDDAKITPGERDANLGLASTRELLIELQARGGTGRLWSELAPYAGALRDLEESAGRLHATLPRPVLEYRTAETASGGGA